jgi:hypothetical protein
LGGLTVSYEDARSVAALVAGGWMIVAVPLFLFFWIRGLRHALALRGLRSRRVKASDPDPEFLTAADREHMWGLIRQMGYAALCVLPPMALAIVFGLT